MEGLGLRRAGHWDLRGVTFTLVPGEAWGVIGESGAGKSTLLSLILGLVEPTEGRILLEGAPWSPLPESERRRRRPRLQAVLQDALASLPPHRTGWEILQEPLEVWGRGSKASRREAAGRMADRVRFPVSALDQHPSAWSGGLAQRLCLGRALMLEPTLLVLDEPFSALDPTLGSQLLSLLLDLNAEGTALLLVSHDLTLVEALCSRMLLLKGGVPQCQGDTRTLLSGLPDPHLRALWQALPGRPTAVGDELAGAGR